jgi:O-antigen ligase
MKNTMFRDLGRWSVVLLCFSLAFSRSLFAIAGILVLIGLVIDGQWRGKASQLKQNLPALSIVLMVMWFYLTYFWTKATQENFAYAANVHWKLLLIPAIVLLIQDERWLERCWKAFAAGMVILLLHVYALEFISPSWVHGSPDGVFFNPLPQSVGLAIFSSLCLIKLLGTKNRWQQVTWAVLFVMASYVVLNVSQQRLGYLTWIVGGLLAIGLQLNTKQKPWVVLSALLFMVVVLMSNDKMQARISLAVNEVKA